MTARRGLVQSKTAFQKWYAKNRDEHLANMRAWRKANRAKLAEATRLRRATDPIDKLKNNLRVRLNNAVKCNRKTGSAIRDLGCSIDEFKNHIESKFKSGMTWDNYGDWHFDHITPLSSFNLADRKEFCKAVHFSNIQPLWKKENISKGSRIDIMNPCRN